MKLFFIVLALTVHVFALPLFKTDSADIGRVRVDSIGTRTQHFSGAPAIATLGDSCAWFTNGVIGHASKAAVASAISSNISAGTIPMGSASTGLTASTLSQSGICVNGDSLHLANGATIAGPLGVGIGTQNVGLFNMYSALPTLWMSDNSSNYACGIRTQFVNGIGERMDLGYYRASTTYCPVISLMDYGGVGRAGVNTIAPGNAFTVVGNQTVNPGFTATFSSGLSNGNAGNQINITNSAAAWGIVFGFDDATASTSIYHGGYAAYLVNVQNGPLNFGINNGLGMTLCGAGLGIGVTTANTTSELTVAGPVALNSPAYVATDTHSSPYAMTASSSTLIFTSSSGNSQTITLQSAGSYVGRILFLTQLCGIPSLNSANNDVILITGGSPQSVIINYVSGGDLWAILQSNGTNWQVIAIG